MSFSFTDAKSWAPHLKDCDVNVVTGLLKLYLRELPEALFTDKLYPSLLEGNGKMMRLTKFRAQFIA